MKTGTVSRFASFVLAVSAMSASGSDSGVKVVGRIEALPSGTSLGQWTVAAQTVVVTNNTKLDFEAGLLVSGTCVEVRGQSSNNSIQAGSIESVPADRCVSKSSKVQIFGSIQQLPASGRVGDWKVGDTTVHVAAQTEIEQNGGPVAIGSCAEVEGGRNSDGTVTATEIDVRSGIAGCLASLPNGRPEVSFRGTAQLSPPGGVGLWTVAGRRVQVSSTTPVQPRNRSLNVGDCLDVDGNFLGDGSILAARIQIIGNGVCRNGLEHQVDIRFFGLIQTLSAGTLTGDWQVSNQTVRVGAGTRLVSERGPFSVGACVQVSGDLAGNVITAQRVEVERASQCSSQTGGVFVFTGSVEQTPPSGNIGNWTIGGRVVTTNASTVLDTSKGQLLLGACVTVTGTLQAAIVASRIEVLSTSGACILPGGVVGAGNLSGTGVVAGQIISIFGRNIGPATTIPLVIAGGLVQSKLGNTRVLFDGAEATLLFVSDGQINAIVPCGVAGKQSVRVQVEFGGAWSNVVTLPVLAAAPSLFTIAASGAGPGAILNFDLASGYSLNTVANAAARGATVLLFATGMGPTTPACSDGTIVPLTGPFPRPALAVTVEIGGRPATVQFAGGAPGLVNGLTQVNAVVPADAPVGPNVPIVVRAGSASSQAGVTISVK